MNGRNHIRSQTRADLPDARGPERPVPDSPAVALPAVERFKSCRWRCDAGGWRVLHASRRAAVCRQGRIRRRVVVPGVRVLQAAPHPEEARTDRLHTTERWTRRSVSLADLVNSRIRAIHELTASLKTPARGRPTPRSAPDPGTPSSAASPRASGRSFPASPPDRSARRHSRD